MCPPLRSLVPVLEDEVALVLQRNLPDDVAEVTVERAASTTATLQKKCVCVRGRGGEGLLVVLKVFAVNNYCNRS